MLQTNIQRPFSYQQKKRMRVLTPAKTIFLSKQVKGMCPYCRYFTQKIKHFNSKGQAVEPLCPKCAKNKVFSPILEFPATLIPWKIVGFGDINIHNSFHQFNFCCQICKKLFCDFNTFGALCGHKKHTPPNFFCCRWCCTKVQADSIKKVKISTQKPNRYNFYHGNINRPHHMFVRRVQQEDLIFENDLENAYE